MFINDSIENIEELDLVRHMNDNASRFEMNSTLQKRYTQMQKILLKAQTLSEKDFETAFTTFESVIESLNQKKQNHDRTDDNSKNKLSNYLSSSR